MSGKGRSNAIAETARPNIGALTVRIGFWGPVVTT